MDAPRTRVQTNGHGVVLGVTPGRWVAADRCCHTIVAVGLSAAALWRCWPWPRRWRRQLTRWWRWWRGAQVPAGPRRLPLWWVACMDAGGATVQANRDGLVFLVAPHRRVATHRVGHAVVGVGHRAPLRCRHRNWSWCWRRGRMGGTYYSACPRCPKLQRVIRMDTRHAAVQADCHRLIFLVAPCCRVATHRIRLAIMGVGPRAGALQQQCGARSVMLQSWATKHCGRLPSKAQLSARPPYPPLGGIVLVNTGCAAGQTHCQPIVLLVAPRRRVAAHRVISAILCIRRLAGAV